MQLKTFKTIIIFHGLLWWLFSKENFMEKRINASDMKFKNQLPPDFTYPSDFLIYGRKT